MRKRYATLGSTGVAESTVTGVADSFGMRTVEARTSIGGKVEYGSATGEHSTNVVDNHFADSIFVVVEVTPPQVAGSQDFFEW